MGASRISEDQKNHYFALRKRGWSQAKACAEAGFSIGSAKAFEGQASNGNEWRALKQPKSIPDNPVDPAKWPDAAQEALADKTGFLFCKRYMGLELSPWQQTGWQVMEEAWASGDRSYVCENAPPGLGKSTKGVGFAAKLIVLDRSVRTMFISRQSGLAERNTVRLRHLLARTAPPTEGESTLSADFGRFKPKAGGDVWQRHRYVVEQADGLPIDEKEPTCSAFGFDSEWLGFRIDFVFGDDLDSGRSIRNMEIVEANRDIFDNELEARLEPGGLFMIAQQRLGPYDFSNHALSKRIAPYFDGNDDNADVEGELQYEHIVFKAHYEDRCKGRESHRSDAAGYPDGCLLDPNRLPWPDVRKAMVNKRKFSVVYQQEESDDDDVLVQKLWVDGGKGPDGVEYLGCWDNDRAVGEVPSNLHGDTFSVLAIDPSPTRYWGITWWIHHFASEQRWLVDVVKARMEAPELLEWSPEQNCFTGLAEDWWHRSVKLGYPLQALCMERNAAQRFLFQMNFYARWSSLRGVLLMPHDTSMNKHDPELGVQMLGPLYKHGRVRLPGKGQEARLASLKLIEEVTRYPGGGTSDLLMSQWFNELAASKQVVVEDEDAVLWTPSWLRQPVTPGYL